MFRAFVISRSHFGEYGGPGASFNFKSLIFVQSQKVNARRSAPPNTRQYRSKKWSIFIQASSHLEKLIFYDKTTQKLRPETFGHNNERKRLKISEI